MVSREFIVQPKPLLKYNVRREHFFCKIPKLEVKFKTRVLISHNQTFEKMIYVPEAVTLPLFFRSLCKTNASIYRAIDLGTQ